MTTPLSPTTLVYGFTPAADPDVSPDGTRIAYTLGATNRETHKGSSQVWLCDIDGANKRRLTWSGERNRFARWSPSGEQLAFISDRVSKNGLFVMPMYGGEARELVHQEAAIGDIAWSPSGDRIAFTSLFDPQNPGGKPPAEGAAPPVRVTDRIDYKQDNRGYLGDSRDQIFIVEVASGECRQLTHELSNHVFPRWSPDGSLIAAAISTHNGMRSRLALIPVDGGEATLLGT
ncbi:MAG: hypothetical protein ABI305_03685, partial [Tepidiformaceae bacterium]